MEEQGFPNKIRELITLEYLIEIEEYIGIRDKVVRI